MKDIVGSPGTRSGLALRVSHCLCAAATLVALVTARGNSFYSAFSFVFVSMLLQLLWSFGLACLDIHSLRTKLDFHDYFIVGMLLYGDSMLAILLWASASASAGVTIFMDRDVHFCSAFPHLSCGQYKLFVILAFLAWSFTAASAGSLFWLLASLLG